MGIHVRGAMQTTIQETPTHLSTKMGKDGMDNPYTTITTRAISGYAPDQEAKESNKRNIHITTFVSISFIKPFG